MPGKGLGYGLLRYLNGETAAELAGLPAPQLGLIIWGGSRPVALARTGRPPLDGRGSDADDGQLSGGDPAMPLAHVIEINALTLDGTQGPALSAHWTFAPALLGAAAVEDLAATWFRALTALVQACGAAGRGGAQPKRSCAGRSDASEIERLEGDYGTIEEILPLSPLQEGLLFHALYDAAGPDVYTVQLELELEGAVEPAMLEASLQAVIGRHASLRCGFRHEQLVRPVQVVLPRVAAPWRLIDLSGLDAAGSRSG